MILQSDETHPELAIHHNAVSLVSLLLWFLSYARLECDLDTPSKVFTFLIKASSLNFYKKIFVRHSRYVCTYYQKVSLAVLRSNKPKLNKNVKKFQLELIGRIEVDKLFRHNQTFKGVIEPNF